MDYTKSAITSKVWIDHTSGTPKHTVDINFINVIKARAV